MDYSKYIGIPYEKMDCFKLSKEFYKNELGVELKNYYDLTPEDRLDQNKLIYSNIGDFVKVEGDPSIGDLALIKVYGVESHIAVYVGDGMMLHTAKKTGSILEPISKWKRLITGFYRVSKADD